MEEMTMNNNAEQNKEVVEKKVKKSNVELLEEVKAELKETQKKIKELKANKEKTEQEKAELKQLQDKIPALKVNKATLEKKVNNAKINAIIRTQGKKMAEKKQEAINKVLNEEGLNTENSVKGLIALRRVCLKYNVNGNKTLEKCLEYVRQNAPTIINNN